MSESNSTISGNASGGNTSNVNNGCEPEGKLVEVLNEMAPAAGDAIEATLIARPGENMLETVNLEAGQKYVFDFEESEVQSFIQEGDQLTLTFDDGGKIILEHFSGAVSADQPATLAYQDSVSEDIFSTLAEMEKNMPEIEVLDEPQANLHTTTDDALQNVPTPTEKPQDLASSETIAEKLAQINTASGEEDSDAFAIAEALAQVEPAAGDTGGATGGSSGYGFNSKFSATPLNSPDAIGPLNPTALAYGLPEGGDRVIPQNTPAAAAPDPLNPEINVEDQLVFEDGSVNVVLDIQPENPDSTMTVQITGIPSTWTVGGPGTYDPGTGIWTYTTTTPGDPITAGPTLSPPADTDGDLPDLGIRVVETDPTTGQSGITTDTFDIITDAVADTPDVDANNVSGDEDTAIALDVDTHVTDMDGSEEIVSVVFSGVPDGFSLSSGIKDPSTGDWIVNQSALSTLTVSAPQDYSGTITLTMTSTAQELNHDGTEPILSNNTADNSTTFDVTWRPVADDPTINVDDVWVKEDGSVSVPLTVTNNDTDGSEYLTVTVTGIDASWDFVAPIGTYNAATGTWTYTATAGQDVSTTFTFSPPTDSDVDLTNLHVTATSTEVANNDTATSTDNFNVFVDAVIDPASITADDVQGNEDTAIAIDMQGFTGEGAAGNETVSGYQISGVDPGFSFNQGTNLGGGVWSFTPAQLSGLTISSPTDYVGTISLTGKVFTQENPGDAENDTSDNTTYATDPFTVTWDNTPEPPTIEVNNGVDDAWVKEDGSVDVPITAALGTGHAATEVLTVTVTGIDASWGFTPAVGTYNSAAGTWTYTAPAGQDISTTMNFAPPHDSDIDLTGLSAVATATDNGVSVSSGPDGFNVLVDAVADIPTVNGHDNSGHEGDTLNVSITDGATTDIDHSESIMHYQISGVDAGFSLNHGTNLGGGVWQLTPAQLSGLQVTPPSNYVGDLDLKVTIFVKETALNGQENDTSDNIASYGDDFTLTWDNAPEPPTIEVNHGVDDALVYEDGSVDVDITAALGVGHAATEVLTVTVTGIDPAWGFSAPIGTYNKSAGTWTYEASAGHDISTTMTFTPPADSDIDLTGLSATATATDNGVSVDSSPDGFNVVVDAVADDADVSASNRSGNRGDHISLNISGDANDDTDGSETVVKYQISSVDSGFSFNKGHDLGGGVWEFSPSEINGLKVIPKSGNFTGSIDMTVKVFTEETLPNGDYEHTTTNNTDTDTASFSVTWTNPDAHNPNLQVWDAQVKEDNSVDVHVKATLGDSSEHMTITVHDIPNGWQVTGGGWTQHGNDYTKTLGAGQNFDGHIGLKPPHDSDADISNIKVTATEYNGSNSKTDTEHFDVVVDAVVDQAHIDADASVGAVNWWAGSQQRFDLNVKVNVGDHDGSEKIDYLDVNLGKHFSNGYNGYNSLHDMGVTLDTSQGWKHKGNGLWRINVDSESFDRTVSLIVPQAMTADAEGNPVNVLQDWLWDLWHASPQFGDDGRHNTTIPVSAVVKEANLSGSEYDYSDNVTTVHDNVNFRFYITPLVVDLDGDGVELTTTDDGVLFDMDNDGVLDHTSWVGEDDGLLAIDTNHDGVINNQSELFGADDQHGDGFAKLADYDSNGDGIIDAQDDAFADIKVWQDANHDGISQEGELYGLDDLNIASIDLNANEVLETNGDSIITHESTVTYNDGSTSEIVDAWFSVDKGTSVSGVDGQADAFVFDADHAGEAVTITNFNSEEGDVLDISDYLHEYDALQESIDDFVFSTEVDGDTHVYVDASGSGDIAHAQQVAIVEGAIDIDLNQLINHGDAVV